MNYKVISNDGSRKESHDFVRMDIAMANARTFVEINGYDATAKIYMVDEVSEDLVGLYHYNDGQPVFMPATSPQNFDADCDAAEAVVNDNVDEDLEAAKREVLEGMGSVDCPGCGRAYTVEPDAAFDCHTEGCDEVVMSASRRLGII